ncbi:hypothetical protein HF086_002051 [Spodoptera exigua]|uniref:Uncharacterized protein n=1 Tax=Spodoptera exigua TaxID=7107 RepID=A0A922SIC6_SPOEX|nr:hypothetical protein HF086_002051 [Spodoptera exigua]
MESIKPCPILEFNENQLLNVRKIFGYDDLNKLKQDLDQFEDWISKQPHFMVKEFGSSRTKNEDDTPHKWFQVLRYSSDGNQARSHCEIISKTCST